MPVVTISDYQNYRSPQHPFTRQCPNFRTCWPGLSASYNPFVSSRSLMLRRIAFLLIQALQLGYLLPYVFHFPTSPTDTPWSISTILFFFFVAWNLHLIVKMEGSRIVMGKRFSRNWFDGFLWSLVAAYAGLLGWRVYGGGEILAVNTAWVVLDLAIFAVAWVSTWTPDNIVLATWDDQV